MNPALDAFTMVEIALALAIIGFALVAIIGILPAGLSVQRESREKTIINQEALFWFDALRGDRPDTVSIQRGMAAFDDLPFYVKGITNFVTEFDSTTGVLIRRYQLDYAPNTPFAPTNSALIVGLLTTPKWVITNGVSRSNYPVAYVRALSGSAVEKPPQSNPLTLDLAFGYRMAVEVSTHSVPDVGSNRVAQALAGNLHDLRLYFRWPLLTNGSSGAGFETYRTEVGGSLERVPGGTDQKVQPDLYYFRSRQYAPVAVQP